MFRNIIGKIRYRRVMTYFALVLVIAVSAAALFTDLIGRSPKTKAFDISSPDNYYLDGWQMTNVNALGRVAPSTDINGSTVTVTGGNAIRFDNSPNGFNNSPLFAIIGGSDPSISSNIVPQSSDGQTHLSSLTIKNASSVTTTPLDFIENGEYYNRAFGVVWTGYYFDSQNNPDLEFGFAADDGAKIEAYYDNGSGANWYSVAENYSNHNLAAPTAGTIKQITYSANTYLPIRITYYNAGASSNTTAGFHLFVKYIGGSWYIPEESSLSSVGRFYTGPDSNTYPEGLVADYYLDFSTDNYKYSPDAAFYSSPYVTGLQTNTFSATSPATPNATTHFPMRNYYYSFIDTKYSHSFDEDRKNYYSMTYDNSTDPPTPLTIAYNGPDLCGFKLNQGYADIGTLIGANPTHCTGVGGLFINKDGSFVREDTGLVNLTASDETDANGNPVLLHATDGGWIGGNSNLRLNVSGLISIGKDGSKSAIDVSASGWPGGPQVDGSKETTTFGCDNQNGWCFDAYGLGTGGGAIAYNPTGVAAGGSYGGSGARSQVSPWSTYAGATYGDETNADFAGSGGGASSVAGSRGGPGGGVINIQCSTISMDWTKAKITANGGPGVNNGGDGSGGGIFLLITDKNSATDFLTKQPTIKADGAYNSSGTRPQHYYGRGGGGRIYLEGNFNTSDNKHPTGLITDSIIHNIEALAGGCDTIDHVNCQSDKGSDPNLESFPKDGTVYITSQKNFPVKKELEAVQRPYGTNNGNFNPYALMSGDVIKVKITVEKPIVDGTISDDLFRVQPSGALCQPTLVDGVTFYPASGKLVPPDNVKVSWTYVPGADMPYYYYCKVP